MVRCAAPETTDVSQQLCYNLVVSGFKSLFQLAKAIQNPRHNRFQYVSVIFSWQHVCLLCTAQSNMVVFCKTQPCSMLAYPRFRCTTWAAGNKKLQYSQLLSFFRSGRISLFYLCRKPIYEASVAGTLMWQLSSAVPMMKAQAWSGSAQ